MISKNLPGRGLRVILSVLGVLVLFGGVLSVSVQVSSKENSPAYDSAIVATDVESDNWLGLLWTKVTESGDLLKFRAAAKKTQGDTGILEKMIIAGGTTSIDLDLGRLSGGRARTETLGFTAQPDTFFTVLILNNEFRGALPSSMGLVPSRSAELPKRLNASRNQLVLESSVWGEPFELVVRDGKTGFIFFNVEGQEYNYDAIGRTLKFDAARLRLSKEYAAELGRPSDEGALVGTISINADLRTIEISQIENGETTSAVLPADPMTGTVPGPDVVVGDLSGLAQFGSSSGTQVGLAVGTDSCNFGTVDLNWFALPSNDHPVIPQNLYRMSGGATNDLRFEQIGQSSVKHAFTALTNNICSLGCNGVGGTRLGSGCSDPYSASLNSGPSLGSRAWINPFTGDYPRGDSATPPNNHTGHTHLGPSHRILTEIDDLNTSLNPGATYYAESQYVTPHEYVWCQANPGQCNMNNNVSFRRYNVSGTGSPFSFSAAAATVRSKAAVTVWPGATLVDINPAPNVDGIGVVGYKVTNPSAGVWHYEYVIYNQNMDRGIQSFSIPIGPGVNLTNVGFHAPPQHPGWTADGTTSNAGFSSTPWAQTQTGSSMTWASETFAQNPNANAIRWGTLYNFRFDSTRPPQNVSATVGFFKTGAPINVTIQAPTPVAAVKSRADFDGDSKTDLSVFRPTEGNWYLNRSTDGFAVINWGLASDRLIPGDYDGDGKADVAVFRADANASVPDYYFLKSNGFVYSGLSWGVPGDVPVLGDYDGDGKSDAAIFRPSTNTWYILNSGNGSNTVETFGQAGDIPLSFDSDNDGKTNLALFRPSNNTWYVARNTGSPATNFDAIQFGSAGDILVPADYDGDNKDDFAVFRPSNGVWYIRRSSDGIVTFNAWGTNGDVPVPGDYDGDGKDDAAVYRNGVWYINRSTAGVLIQGFGLGTDVAVPKAYIP